jgi:DNA-binding transcriptional LysR family regulator
MIDSRRLRVLNEVSRARTLAGAADALGYTPSAVSQQLRALEREAGVALLERRGRGVALTEPGRALAAHAARVADALAAAEEELRAIAGLRAGSLRLGWFTTAGATLMPRTIARFRARHPGVELSLREIDRDECSTALRAGELDLALVYEFPLGEPWPRDLPLRHLLEDPLYVALPRDHPLAAERRRIGLGELEDEPWVQGVHHGSTLSRLPEACRRAGFEMDVAFRTDDHMAVQGLVAAGVGVAAIPQLTLPATRDDVAVREVDAPALVRQVGVAMSPGRYRPPAAEAMADLLEEVAAELMEEAAGRLGGDQARP